MNSVILLTDKGAVRTMIPVSLQKQLITNIQKNGRESVHTNEGSYEVTGLIIGEIKEKVIIL